MRENPVELLSLTKSRTNYGSIKVVSLVVTMQFIRELLNMHFLIKAKGLCCIFVMHISHFKMWEAKCTVNIQLLLFYFKKHQSGKIPQR